MRNLLSTKGRKVLPLVYLLIMLVGGLVAVLPSISPNKAHAASYPGGMWVYPGNGFTFEPGVWYNLKAQAYPTHSGDPAISYVNFTGYWGGNWHLICRVYNHDSSLVYTCPTDFRYANNMNYPPAGQMLLSFDVYASDGGVNYAPNGVHSGTYRAFTFGGVWSSPGDGFRVQSGSNLHLSAWAWPSNNGPALDSVHFTGYWSGSWHTICRAGAGADGDVHKYACDWNPSASGVPSGTFWVSFDVYDAKGNVKWGPNGTHSGTLVSNVKPGGIWITSGPSQMEPSATYTLKVRAYRTNPGDPAINYVNFTGYWDNAWHLICQVSNIDPGTADQYSCKTDFRSVNGGKYPSSYWIGLSFDVYDKSGNINWGSNGIHWVTYHHSLALLAPFPNGTNFTVVAGYNDLNPGQSCTIPGVLDHCQNQLFGLDLVPTNTSAHTVLAPVGGTVTLVSGTCIFIRMDDNINLSVCHMVPSSIVVLHQGDVIPRGKFLGQFDTHVHLNLDKREALGYCCKNYPPVPFTGDHTIQGVNLTPNHHGTGVAITYLRTTYVVEHQEWHGWSGQSTNNQI